MSTKNHVIQVNPKTKGNPFQAGSAREAYYNAILKYNGKTVGEFAAACKEQPPALPKSGKFEATSGWVSWFRRKHYIKLQAPK